MNLSKITQCVALVLALCISTTHVDAKKKKRNKSKRSKVAGKAINRIGSVQSIRVAINDMIATFGERYPDGKNYLAELDSLDKISKSIRSDYPPEGGTPTY